MEYKIKCTNWRPIEKNTLQGFATFELVDVGLVIKDCALHQKDGDRWISLPRRPYTDKTGETAYASIMYCAGEDAKQAFQTAALEALDSYLRANTQTQAANRDLDQG